MKSKNKKKLDGGRRELGVKGDKNKAYTTLHDAINKKASTEVIMKMIEVGGRELLMKKNNCKGYTALHDAINKKKASNEVIMKMIEVGGHELLMERMNTDTLHCIIQLKRKLQLELSWS